MSIPSLVSIFYKSYYVLENNVRKRPTIPAGVEYKLFGDFPGHKDCRYPRNNVERREWNGEQKKGNNALIQNKLCVSIFIQYLNFFSCYQSK